MNAEVAGKATLLEEDSQPKSALGCGSTVAELSCPIGFNQFLPLPLTNPEFSIFLVDTVRPLTLALAWPTGGAHTPFALRVQARNPCLAHKGERGVPFGRGAGVNTVLEMETNQAGQRLRELK